VEGHNYLYQVKSHYRVEESASAALEAVWVLPAVREVSVWVHPCILPERGEYEEEVKEEEKAEEEEEEEEGKQQEKEEEKEDQE
jgi:hypothetical protein